MSAQSRILPPKPNLRYLQDQARLILQQHRNRDSACYGILKHLRRFSDTSPNGIFEKPVGLQAVQHALALEYGC